MWGSGSNLSHYMSLDSSLFQSRKIVGAIPKFISDTGRSGAMIESLITQNRENKENGNFGNIMSSAEKMRGQVGGLLGQTVDNQIDQFTAEIERLTQAAGGIGKVDSNDLANAIRALYRGMEDAARTIQGENARIVQEQAEKIGKVGNQVRKHGLKGAGGASRAMRSGAMDYELSGQMGQVGKTFRHQLAGGLAANSGLSNRMKSDIRNVYISLRRGMRVARNDQDRFDALKQAQQQISAAGKVVGATAEDRTFADNLSESFGRRLGVLQKSFSQKEAQKVGLKLAATGQGLARGIGNLFGVIRPTATILAKGIETFNTFNHIANGFARQQIGITTERGQYGRMLRGSGIKPRDMMTSIAAGRTAGMDDGTIIKKMVGLQQQLAQARWGEGPLINAVGRWGGSPYNADGTVKSQHEMMIEYSRILKSLGSDIEKLQFLGDINFSPDQREFVENYEAVAARHERIKGNSRLQGVLERADIIDESGFAAKVDAATKKELRRREILNQNAIDQGLIPGVKRMLHPDNWFFSDWTARQQGVESAKSEDAIKALTEEIKNLTSEIEKNGGEIGVGSLTTTTTNIDVKQLKALSLRSGWAQASEKNFGDKSPVKILRQLIDKQQTGLTSDKQEKLNAGFGGGVGMLGGMALGALTGAQLGSWAGHVGMAVGGLLGAAVGGYQGWHAGAEVTRNHTPQFLDFSNEDVKKAKKAAKGSLDDWEEWKKNTGLTSLKRSQVLDVDFDKEALEGAKIQNIIQKATELAGGKEVDITQLGGDKYLWQMTAGSDSGSAEFESRVIEALARTADENIGRDEAILAILKHGVQTSDPNVAKKIEELTKINLDKGMSSEGARQEAQKQVVEEVKAEALASSDILSARIQENKKAAEEGYAKHQQEASQIETDNNTFSSLASNVQAQFVHAQKTNAIARSMNFNEWLQMQAKANNPDVRRLYGLEERGIREFSRETGEVTKLQSPTVMTKEEWEKKNGYGETENDKERRAYQQLQQEGLGDIPFEKLTATIKSDKITKELARKNYAGSKQKNASDELNTLDEDALVAKLALELNTSEDEIRNNILSSEAYQEISKKRDEGKGLDRRDALRLKVYENSTAFKAKKKEEEAKAQQHAVEEETDVNDLATIQEAMRITNVQSSKDSLSKMRERIVDKYGLREGQKKRLDELRKKKIVGGLQGQELTREEAKEYADLGSREENIAKSKVDRKRLIRLVAAKGADLQGNFSAEEIEEYKAEQAAEKEKFIGSGGTEGQYKLFQNIRNREILGAEIQDKEKAFLEKSQERINTFKPKKVSPKLEGLHDKEKGWGAQHERIKAKGNKQRAEFQRMQQAGVSIAEMGDMAEIQQLKRSGMPDSEIKRRYGDTRMSQYRKYSSMGVIPDTNRNTSRREIEGFDGEGGGDSDNRNGISITKEGNGLATDRSRYGSRGRKEGEDKGLETARSRHGFYVRRKRGAEKKAKRAYRIYNFAQPGQEGKVVSDLREMGMDKDADKLAKQLPNVKLDSRIGKQKISYTKRYWARSDEEELERLEASGQTKAAEELRKKIELKKAQGQGQGSGAATEGTSAGSETSLVGALKEGGKVASELATTPAKVEAAEKAAASGSAAKTAATAAAEIDKSKGESKPALKEVRVEVARIEINGVEGTAQQQVAVVKSAFEAALAPIIASVAKRQEGY